MIGIYRYYRARKHPRPAFQALFVFWIIVFLFLIYLHIRPSPFRFINDNVLSQYCHGASNVKYKEKFDWDKYLMGEDRFAREIKRLEVKKGDLVVLESTVYNDPKQPSIRYISKKFNVEQLEYQLEPIIQFDETSASSLFRRNGDLYVINASYDLCTSEELADLSNHWFESIKKK